MFYCISFVKNSFHITLSLRKREFKRHKKQQKKSYGNWESSSLDMIGNCPLNGLNRG